MRISDWSSDVCSSDLAGDHTRDRRSGAHLYLFHRAAWSDGGRHSDGMAGGLPCVEHGNEPVPSDLPLQSGGQEFPDYRGDAGEGRPPEATPRRSEEHTSELQSLMRSSYAVFCLKKKKKNNKIQDESYI